eukprot:4793624-Pleurochrysis_carterae.AAC.1
MPSLRNSFPFHLLKGSIKHFRPAPTSIASGREQPFHPLSLSLPPFRISHSRLTSPLPGARRCAL